MKIFENKNIKYLIIPMIILTITASITITIQTIKQYKAVTITLNEKIAEIMGKISESNPEMDSREIIEILNSAKNTEQYEKGQTELSKYGIEIDKINSIDNLLEKAIILNLWLSYCQFFYDGNKRTARLSSNLILLSNDIGVLSIPARYKVEYNKLMLDFYETLEADEVIKFILEKCITFFDGFNYKKYNELI